MTLAAIRRSLQVRIPFGEGDVSSENGNFIDATYLVLRELRQSVTALYNNTSTPLSTPAYQQLVAAVAAPIRGGLGDYAQGDGGASGNIWEIMRLLYVEIQNRDNTIAQLATLARRFQQPVPKANIGEVTGGNGNVMNQIYRILDLMVNAIAATD